jgi:uncharacterized RDD family membrane protein YckC
MATELSEALISTIIKKMHSRSSVELQAIYSEQNDEEWSPEAFEAIRRILAERVQTGFEPPVPPQTHPLPDIISDSSQQLATRGSRLGAVLLDGLIIMVITIPLNWITGSFKRTMAYSQADPSLLKLPNAENLFWSAFGLMIFVAINWSFLREGQTIGKRALGIRIVRKDGSPIAAQRIIGLRMIPMQIAALLPGLNMVIGLVDGLLIFRKGRNTLHDDIADTKVIVVSKKVIIVPDNASLEA